VGGDPAETQELLRRVGNGDPSAFDALFDRHRKRLHRAVRFRLDRRVAARADASDVVQDTYQEAARRLPQYLERPPMPFYLWLRWIAREKVIALHRKHLHADKRALEHEVPLLPADSSAELVSGIIGRGPTPSQELAAAEMADMLRRALEQLEPDERDVVLWRHFEQLSARETAELLGITEAAAAKRYIRTLEKLRRLLVEMGVSRPG
jgi:RNA polymerase sigma-70 factor, ECF subfamily